jgi:hypothetical protein
VLAKGELVVNGSRRAGAEDGHDGPTTPGATREAMMAKGFFYVCAGIFLLALS